MQRVLLILIGPQSIFRSGFYSSGVPAWTWDAYFSENCGFICWVLLTYNYTGENAACVANSVERLLCNYLIEGCFACGDLDFILSLFPAPSSPAMLGSRSCNYSKLAVGEVNCHPFSSVAVYWKRERLGL